MSEILKTVNITESQKQFLLTGANVLCEKYLNPAALSLKSISSNTKVEFWHKVAQNRIYKPISNLISGILSETGDMKYLSGYILCNESTTIPELDISDNDNLLNEIVSMSIIMSIRNNIDMAYALSQFSLFLMSKYIDTDRQIDTVKSVAYGELKPYIL